MYCRMYIKVNGLSKDSQGRNIKILHSDMPVFKNAKWPTYVYVIKNITQTVVIYSKSRYHGRKLKSWYVIGFTCYFVPRVWDTCTGTWQLFGYIFPRTHYICFLDGSLRCALRPSVKSKRSCSLQVPEVFLDISPHERAANTSREVAASWLSRSSLMGWNIKKNLWDQGKFTVMT